MASSLNPTDPLGNLTTLSVPLNPLSTALPLSPGTTKLSTLDPAAIPNPYAQVSSLNDLSSNLENIASSARPSSTPNSPQFKASIEKSLGFESGFNLQNIHNSTDTSVPVLGVHGTHTVLNPQALNKIGTISNTDLVQDIIKSTTQPGGLVMLQLEYSSEMSLVTPIFDFLNKIKASETSNAARLYELPEKYSHVRSFAKSPQSAFITLAFAFFEQFFLKSPQLEKLQNQYPLMKKILKQDIETSLGAPRLPYHQFISDIKKFIKEKDIHQGSSLYQSMCHNPHVYEASLILFIEIILESLKSSNFLVPSTLHTSTTPSFRWMNDVPLAEETYYRELSQILEASLSVIILTFDAIEQKTFLFKDSSEVTQNTKTLPEITLLIDKRYDASHLLYTSKEQRKSQGSVTRLLSKQPSQFNFLNTLQRKGANTKEDSPLIPKTPSARDEKRKLSLEMLGDYQYTVTAPFDFSSEAYEKKKLKDEFISSLPQREQVGPGNFADAPILQPAKSTPSSMLSGVGSNSFGLAVPDVDAILKKSGSMDQSSTNKSTSKTITISEEAKLLLENALKNFKFEASGIQPVTSSHKDLATEQKQSESLPSFETVDQILKRISSGVPGVLSTESTMAIKSIPGMLKEKFITCNMDVQKHESELKLITERYLSEKKEENSQKSTKEMLLSVAKKYEEIIKNKQATAVQENDEEEFSGGSGMRMDS